MLTFNLTPIDHYKIGLNYLNKGEQLMPEFTAFSPNVKVNRQTILALVNGMGSIGIFKKMALDALKTNGIELLKSQEWYPQQAWLNTFNYIAKEMGPQTLFQIGKKVPENAKFPPHIKSLEEALNSIDVTHHLNHKDGEIGHYDSMFVNDSKAVIISNNPYPCEFDRGIIEGICHKFKTKNTAFFVVEHDDKQPCRRNGAYSCTYFVSWVNRFKR